MILAVILIFFGSLSYSTCLYTYKTRYIDLPVDHFSFSNNLTFSLRYLLNDSYWNKDDGPIFFYTGNEGDIELFAQNTGFLWESAPKFDALIVFAEHRYYGKSLPFGNASLTSPEYFGYLTSEQALADYVDLIFYLINGDEKEELAGCPSCDKKWNPVIAFGGSYGGMLAAWLRMKYPSVVEGSLASSAPIWQFKGLTACNAFYKVATEAFRKSSGQKCVSNIRKSWNILQKFTKDEAGKNWINKNWKLCPSVTSTNDINKLSGWLSNTYIYTAMINYPYPTNFLKPVPANPVKEMCKPLSKSLRNKKKLLQAVFEAVSVYFNYTGKAKCLQWNNNNSIPELGIDGWNIQACTEMVMPFCTNGNTDMFKPAKWNYKSNSQFCYNKYKVRPRDDMVGMVYGGKDLRAFSNIIFSNGDLDPWKSGGVTTPVLSPTIKVIMMPDAAHHLDLRAANKNDPKSVIEARKQYHEIFKKWINDYRKKN